MYPIHTKKVFITLKSKCDKARIRQLIRNEKKYKFAVKRLTSKFSTKSWTRYALNLEIPQNVDVHKLRHIFHANFDIVIEEVHEIGQVFSLNLNTKALWKTHVDSRIEPLIQNILTDAYGEILVNPGFSIDSLRDLLLDIGKVVEFFPDCINECTRRAPESLDFLTAKAIEEDLNNIERKSRIRASRLFISWANVHDISRADIQNHHSSFNTNLMNNLLWYQVKSESLIKGISSLLLGLESPTNMLAQRTIPFFRSFYQTNNLKNSGRALQWLIDHSSRVIPGSVCSLESRQILSKLLRNRGQLEGAIDSAIEILLIYNRSLKSALAKYKLVQ